MRLKSDLRKRIEQDIRSHNISIERLRKTLDILEATNIQEATYIVHLNSCWGWDNQKSTITAYTGLLEDAIKKAESEFRDVNHGDNIKARYTVKIMLGERELYLQEKDWEQYTERYRK